MQLTIQIPDTFFSNYQKKKAEKLVKLYTALMMYRSGEISAGSACEMAEIDRFTFISECKNHDIPVISYTIDEIENEIQHFIDNSK